MKERVSLYLEHKFHCHFTPGGSRSLPASHQDSNIMADQAYNGGLLRSLNQEQVRNTMQSLTLGLI